MNDFEAKVFLNFIAREILRGEEYFDHHFRELHNADGRLMPPWFQIKGIAVNTKMNIGDKLEKIAELVNFGERVIDVDKLMGRKPDHVLGQGRIHKI